MPEISELTYQVVAYTEVPNFDTDICVDWAFDMVFLGFDTPTLLVLAGLDKPTNYFQTIEYLKAALRELKIKQKFGDEAVISYSSFFIAQIAKEQNIKENLKQVYNFCQAKNYEGLIYDFYLLYWAWGDLDYGQEMQHHWDGATNDNIEAIVVDTAEQWLKANAEQYAQHQL
ncbi:hypothetical protein [Hymenobacter koreensis]|uniref:DUF1266 domain-containing protein n=1 Tax=Hymenobacter koreensis TaxID=1084523 RepID=A0ABP8IYT8_9BACT